MEGRRDALAAAAELVLEVERLARSTAGLRATVGTIAVEPGASNVVPGTARFSVDVRHAHDDVRTAAVAEILARAEALAEHRGVEFLVTQEEHHAAVPADPVLTELLGRGRRRDRASPASPGQRRRPRCRRDGRGRADGHAVPAQSRAA